MKELLEIYDLDDNLIEIKEREQFYQEAKKEFAEQGKITRKVKTVRVLLMNSCGRIYLQKRSKLKKENPGLYDKTVGGHVKSKDSFDVTAIRECAEELGFPMAILKTSEFDEAVKNIDLNTIGIFKQVDYIPSYLSERVSTDGYKFLLPYMTSTYIGYYDGAIKFIDGESSGIEVFSPEELIEEIKIRPEKFTKDIKFMVEKYKDLLVPIK